MSKKQNILVCDDEREVVQLVAHLLERTGYEVQGCFDADAALRHLHEGSFDLVILDIMMPGVDGFELLRCMRADSNPRVADVPVIFFSAKTEELDKVVGFTLGADDYVTKPFKPRELVVRVRARLRRRTSRPDALSLRDIEVCEAAHEATLHGEPLALTPTEFACLVELLRAGGMPLSARELFEAVWKVEYGSSSHNTVMVYIRRVRKKLAAVDSSQEYIETVWGVGYRIAPDPKR